MDGEWLSDFSLSAKKVSGLLKTNACDLFLRLSPATGTNSVASAQPIVVKNPPISMIVGLMSH
jgi:hypothetical protein